MNHNSDWLDAIVQNDRQVVEKFPFLRARIDEKVVDGLTYPRIRYAIQVGWYGLFYQMCNDIKAVLVEMNLLDKFFIMSVYERYGQMKFSTNMVIPQISAIMYKYSKMSNYICCKCGQFAANESYRYYSPLCNKCAKEMDFITRPADHYGYTKVREDCEDEWDRYFSEEAQFAAPVCSF